MLPNFLIIGAMKSGTTSLYHYIKTHPEIFMPAFKEPNFFIKKDIQKRDLEWYEALFSGSNNAKALGEASVNYTKYPHYQGVPQRIASFNKNMRLIYVLRNPLARTCSHYLHNIYAGIETESLRDAIVKRPLYIQASLYYMQIQEYLKHFSSDQLLILLFEDLKKDPIGIVRKVFDFLEVDEQFVPPNIGEVKHQTKQKRGKDRLIASFIKEMPFYHNINNAIPDRLKLVAGFLLKKNIDFTPPESEDLPEEAKKLIIEDLNKLSEFLNKDLLSWIEN